MTDSAPTSLRDAPMGAEKTQTWGLPPKPDNIPDTLRTGRWCTWRAQSRPGTDKMDKVPCNALSGKPISTAKPGQWADFETAAGVMDVRNGVNGLGRLVERDGIVCLDLDHCVDIDTFGADMPVLEPWAQTIVDRFDTYTELSPSGKGLRLFFKGTLPGPDFSNNVEGVEAYGGSAPRYVTVTGWRLENTPDSINAIDPALLRRFYKRYAPASKDTLADLPQPDLVEQWPNLQHLGLSASDLRAMQTGLEGDRSHELQRLARVLYSLGLTDAQVLSILWDSDGTREVALDHRRQDPDRALTYLWKHHCLPARDTASVTADDFEDLDSEASTADIIEPQALPDLDFMDFNLPARPWVLGTRLLAGYVTVTVAPGGVSKSMFSMLTAVAIATGQPLTGEPVHRPGKVWIINNEDDQTEILRRLAGICLLHGIDWEQLQENLYISSGYGAPYLFAQVDSKRRVTSHPNSQAIVHEARARGITHLVVDPAISTHDADENDNTAINRVMDAFKYVARELQLSLELVHHTRKTGGDSEAHAGDIEAGRGASALKDAARIGVTLARMSRQTAQRLGLDWAEARRLVRMDSGKGNFALPDEDCAWFRLESVQLPNGDSVGVHEPFDLEPLLAAREEAQAIERDGQRLGWAADMVRVMVEAGLAELGGPELRDRLAPVWDLRRAAVYERMAQAIPWDRPGALQISLGSEDERDLGTWWFWRERDGRGYRVFVVRAETSPDVNGQ